MKKNVNGVLLEMTVDEIAEMEQMALEEAQMEPTPEERISALEDSINRIKSSFSKFEDKLKYLNL